MQNEVLRGLQRLLQTNGQALSTGWPLTLSILMNVVRHRSSSVAATYSNQALSDQETLVPIGFASVSFICSDFLSSLPLDCLALLVTTIGKASFSLFLSLSI